MADHVEHLALSELAFVPETDGEGLMSLKIERRFDGKVLSRCRFVGQEAQTIYADIVKLVRIISKTPPVQSEPADRQASKGLTT